MHMLVRGRGRLVARSLMAGNSNTIQNYSPVQSNYSPVQSNYSPVQSNYSPVQSITSSRQLHQGQVLQDVYNIDGEDDFKNKVMRSRLPVIVNFHADWCEPCHSLRPLLSKIATENTEKLHLAEVLVEDHVELLQAFEVTAVPAVLGIHRGMVVAKFIGLVSHKEITNFVDKLLTE